jgi:hypothetical protein
MTPSGSSAMFKKQDKERKMAEAVIKTMGTKKKSVIFNDGAA